MTRYECDRCGACCRGHLIIEAELLDAWREPRLIEAAPHYAGMPPEAALEELEEPGRALVIACGTDRPCPFLGSDNNCTIYPTRPNDCVGMQTGDEQCQYARKAEGLRPLLPIDEPAECEQAENQRR